MRQHLSKGFLKLYQWAAVVGLYGLLLFVGGYLAILFFYYQSKSWVAPTIISPSNREILAMTETLVTTQQAIETLQSQRQQQVVTIAELEQQSGELKKLDQRLTDAILRERKESAINGAELSGLTQEKRTLIESGAGDIQQVNKFAKTIDAELRAGLLTKMDAERERATFSQLIMDHTDAKIGEVLLRDNVREKTTFDVNTMDILAKKAELETQIATFSATILNSQQQIQTDDMQIKQLQQAVSVAQQSSAYRAMTSKHGVGFAFTRYESEDYALPNTSIYSCLVGPIGCHKVGTIKRIFTDEETAQNPVFKTPMRGFLVELALTEDNAAKSKVLFIGRPLWIF